MKQLATEQLKEIEAILIQKYELTYADVREEVLDHIACEIEEQIEGELLSFEIAKDFVLKKWGFSLKSSSWNCYAGVPQFIANHWLKKDIKVYVLLCLLASVGTYSIMSSKIEINVLIKFFVGLALICLILNVFLIRLTRQVQSYRMRYLRNLTRMFFLITLILALLNFMQYKSLADTEGIFSSSILFFSTLYALLFVIYFAFIFIKQSFSREKASYFT